MEDKEGLGNERGLEKPGRAIAPKPQEIRFRFGAKTKERKLFNSMILLFLFSFSF